MGWPCSSPDDNLRKGAALNAVQVAEVYAFGCRLERFPIRVKR
jgi:N-acetyl-gamma-glutamylphosphate reductase